MPIYKIPIVHKFGIISHSQRVELQKHILEQAHRKDQKLPATLKANPFQVSEDFVQKYNVANFEEKEVLHNKAEQLLCRSKRRCGMQSSGEGDHVDLPLAWSELAILAQCKGKIQEDCLDILRRSLNEAPLHEENIPTLFFLAESSLYWLHVDAMKQPYLRSAEIKLFKMGQLVFIRLLFHHLAGHLLGLADLKTRLFSYIDAIKDQLSLYQAYPGVLLCFQTILCVGEIIIGPYNVFKSSEEEETAERSESVPAVAACVYRALVLWKIAAVTKINLKKAVLSLLEAVHEISNPGDWLNGFMALSIIGEAAKVNLEVCKVLQRIACGKVPAAFTPNSPEPPVLPSVSPRLTDENPASSADPRKNQSRKLSPSKSPRPRFASPPIEMRTSRSPRSADAPANSADQSPQTSGGVPSPRQPYNIVIANNLVLGLAGWSWENTFQYSQLLTDICLNGTTSEIQKTALMGKWGDADVTTFRAGVANSCVESCGLADLLEYCGPATRPIDPAEDKVTEWTWVVRYGALSGLNRIAHFLHGSKEKAGFRSAAWSLMTSIQDCATTEERILEALRVSQLEFPNSPELRVSGSVWSRVAQSLAEVYLMPPPTPRAPSSLAKSPSKSPMRPQESPTFPKSFINIKRPTLGEELLIHSSVTRAPQDFNIRTSLDLHRLVADQWRKQVINEQKTNENKRILEMDVKRKEDETKQEEMLKKRKEKLKGRPTATLGPYEISSN